MPEPTTSKVVTRFAPSPTGELHIGGARTALYSWAYARRHGGTYLLRFEDTDQKRSSKQAEQNILRDLQWLGLTADNQDASGGIPRQSERKEQGVYDAAIEKLAAAGLTYEDDGAIRFRMGKPIEFDDAVYGHVAVPGADLEDFVIRKADGFPTFHLAVVVDDIDMSVTHVIRGQEHLSNTAKHAALYDALGAQRPVWCHTPSIMNPDGSKMSKRDKAKAARGMLERLSAEERHQVIDLLPQNCWRRAGMLNAAYKHIQQIDDSRGMHPEAQEYWNDITEGFIEKQNDDGIVAYEIARHLNNLLPEIEVRDFARSGYLPTVLLNYIALLGWNPGNDLEQFDLDYMAEHFGFERIGKSNSKFDRDKLAAFNQDAILRMPPEDWAKQLKVFFEKHHPAFVEKLGGGFATFAEMYRERSKTLADPATLGAFFVEAPNQYNDKAVKKNLTKNDGEGLQNLMKIRDALGVHGDWSAESLHALLDNLWQQLGCKNMGGVAQPLRVALTGNAVSPEIGPTLELLGKAETLARIDACLSAVSA